MSTEKVARHLFRQDSTANWESVNPVLARGEVGLEWPSSEKPKLKVGDGSTVWASLDYLALNCELATVDPTSSNTGYNLGTLWLNTTTGRMWYYSATGAWLKVVIPLDLENMGAGDMLASIYAKDTGAGTSTGYVDKALKADKLTTGRTIAISGDGTASGTFNGSANLTLALALAASGVTAGSYTKVTVNSKGLVTAGQSLSSTDIPQITLSKITDAGSAAGYNIGTTSGTIPVLTDNGKIALTEIPDAILGQLIYGGTVNASGVCTLTDNAQTKLGVTSLTMASTDKYEGVYFISTADGTSGVPSTLNVKVGDWIVGNGSAGWAKVDNTDAVISVNGKIGTVTLTTSDITEGTNLYYTAARFASAFASALAAITTDDLAEGTTNLYYTDARAIAAAWPADLIINGGTASTGV